MKKFILTIYGSLFLLSVFGQFKPKGTFIGLEQIKGWKDSLGNEKTYYDPVNPTHKWYHLSVLSFQGDSVFLEQSPVAIYKSDTIFSASDGGFYSYAGTIEKYQGKTFADLRLKSCDYCPNQYVKFRPPKLVKDEDTTQSNTNDTTTLDEPQVFENYNIKFKIMIIEKTKNIDIIKVNKDLYRRQKTK